MVHREKTFCQYLNQESTVKWYVCQYKSEVLVISLFAMLSENIFYSNSLEVGHFWRAVRKTIR